MNPVRFVWAFRNRAAHMPANILQRAERIDSYVPFLSGAALVALLWVLVTHSAILRAQIGLTDQNWALNVIRGIMLGFLRIALQFVVARVSPVVVQELACEEAAHGRVAAPILAFLVGAFAEELWIVVCVVMFLRVGYPVALSIVIVGFVFAAVHFPYRLGALAAALYAALSAIIFLWRGSLIPCFLFHFIGNLGSLYWTQRVRARPPSS
jgi:membrane protease YdiL (CAAX protease family)